MLITFYSLIVADLFKSNAKLQILVKLLKTENFKRPVLNRMLSFFRFIIVVDCIVATVCAVLLCLVASYSFKLCNWCKIRSCFCFGFSLVDRNRNPNGKSLFFFSFFLLFRKICLIESFCEYVIHFNSDEISHTHSIEQPNFRSRKIN